LHPSWEQLPGCCSLVRTTAELVIGLLPEWQFSRKLDLATGYAELQIKAQPER